MKISPTVFAILVVVTFFGIILGFQAAGIWSTSGKVNASGEAIQPDSADVNTIKGWMTLDQISNTFNIPVGDILAHFNLPADTAPSTAIKDLESDTFDTTALREWLSDQHPGAAATPDLITTPVPTTNPLPTDIPVETATPVYEATPKPEATVHTSTPGTLTGKTTFQELLDWGLPVETIQRLIGGDIPDPSTAVKDYVTGQGLEFSTVKTEIQAELDKLPQ